MKLYIQLYIKGRVSVFYAKKRNRKRLVKDVFVIRGHGVGGTPYNGLPGEATAATSDSGHESDSHRVL